MFLDIEIPKKFITQRSTSESHMYGAEAPSISKHLEQERNLAITLVRLLLKSKNYFFQMCTKIQLTRETSSPQ